MLKTEYFYYITEIFKVGSINRASQNLYISQPYLSLCLKKTEDLLGIKVFHRTNKGVIPTAAGKVFLKYCDEIIELIDKSNNLKKIYHTENQKLSITTMPSFTMLDLVQDFRDKCQIEYESCIISYDEIPNTLIPEKLMNGSTDVGVVYITSTEFVVTMEQFRKMSLNFVPLLNEPLYAVVSSHNELYNKDEITLDELRELHFLVETVSLFKNSPPVENNPFPKIFKTKGHHSLKFNNNRSMLHYLAKRADCFCIGQKSLNLTNPSVVSGSLKYIPISDLDVNFTVGYLTNENLQSNDLQEYFIDYLEEHFSLINEEKKSIY